MLSDDFVTAIDGLTFDEAGRTFTLEVDDIDDSEPDVLGITVRVLEAEGEMFFDAPRDRALETAALQDHVVGIARNVVTGRQQSGIRTSL